MFNTKPLILALAIASPFFAVNAQAAEAKPSVVIVHGAFADGSDWAKVVPLLQDKGIKVTVVQNPLTSLADDVAATNRALNHQDGPAILVGHSWGGTVITEAGIHPKVAGLVYVSALSPDKGETTSQQYDGFTSPPEFVLDISEDGYGYVAPDSFQSGFAHDVSDADAAFMRDAQVPINMEVFGTVLEHAAYFQHHTHAISGAVFYKKMEEKAFVMQRDIAREKE